VKKYHFILLFILLSAVILRFDPQKVNFCSGFHKRNKSNKLPVHVCKHKVSVKSITAY